MLGTRLTTPSDTWKNLSFTSSAVSACDLVLRIACLQSSALLYYNMSLWKVTNTANLCVCACVHAHLFFLQSFSFMNTPPGFNCGCWCTWSDCCKKVKFICPVIPPIISLSSCVLFLHRIWCLVITGTSRRAVTDITYVAKVCSVKVPLSHTHTLVRKKRSENVRARE